MTTFTSIITIGGDMGVSAIQDNLSQTLVSIGLPNEISEIRASNFIKSMPNAQKIVVLEQLSNFQFGITVSKFDSKWTMASRNWSAWSWRFHVGDKV